MLSHIRKQKQKGFTIIEVLIVLAIAGLIMLVVFLAVPALQRNARNTQRNADVSGALAAVNEFINNNNGALPTGATVATGILTIDGASGSNSTTAKMGYYKNAGDISMVTGTPTTPGASGTNGTNTNSVVIYTSADCNTLGTLAISGASVSSRAVAATYTLESAAKECKAI